MYPKSGLIIVLFVNPYCVVYNYVKIVFESENKLHVTSGST